MAAAKLGLLSGPQGPSGRMLASLAMKLAQDPRVAGILQGSGRGLGYPLRLTPWCLTSSPSPGEPPDWELTTPQLSFQQQ